MCLCFSFSSGIGLHVTVTVCAHVCVGVCACVHVFYIQTTVPLQIHSSDVGAFGVIGGRGCWRVTTALFGVVEAIVVLVGAR